MNMNTNAASFTFNRACQNLFILGLGLLGITYYNLFPFSCNIPPTAYLYLSFAMIAGFLLRCVRRKLFFGGEITLHQSISFEIVTQIKQFWNPFLPDKAFESEFIARETKMKNGEITEWIKLRVTGSYAIMLLATSWLAYLHKYQNASIFLAIIASLMLLNALLGNRKKPVATVITLIAGIAIWAVEGMLFVTALKVCGVTIESSWMVYLLFTILLEASPIPFGIGIVELPLLIISNGTIFLLVIAFHVLRIIPILFLSIIYLPRYKFRLSDFYTPSLIAIMHSSHLKDNTHLKETRKWKVDLSIIIPAYNEEDRLPGFLTDVREYIDLNGMTAEILVVDDGSKDKTAELVEEVNKEDSRVKLLKQIPNQGKGAAVKRGVMEVEGKYMIYADADGATPITELDNFLPLMMNNSEIIIGSRKAGSEDVDRSRKGIRALMGVFFYTIVNLFAVPGIQDTQCGFKMFRNDIAMKIFRRATEKGWAFDVELLYIAQLLGCPIHEVPVNWHEVEGSKVNPLVDSMKMLVAIFRIRSTHGGFLNDA